jgi:hypothetical protein
MSPLEFMQRLVALELMQRLAALVPRATRTRSPDALGLGQTIEAGVQPGLNLSPALWRAIENRCSDPAAPSDRQDPYHLGLDPQSPPRAPARGQMMI